jgi:hypothetical protein
MLLTIYRILLSMNIMICKVSDLGFSNDSKGFDYVNNDCTMIDTDAVVHQAKHYTYYWRRVQFPEQVLFRSRVRQLHEFRCLRILIDLCTMSCLVWFPWHQ